MTNRQRAELEPGTGSPPRRKSGWGGGIRSGVDRSGMVWPGLHMRRRTDRRKSGRSKNKVCMHWEWRFDLGWRGNGAKSFRQHTLTPIRYVLTNSRPRSTPSGSRRRGWRRACRHWQRGPPAATARRLELNRMGRRTVHRNHVTVRYGKEQSQRREMAASVSTMRGRLLPGIRALLTHQTKASPSRQSRECR